MKYNLGIRATMKCAVAIAILIAAVPFAGAQITPRSDTIYLDKLRIAAEVSDRRAAQVELVAKQSVLRLKTIHNERLPVPGASATAQYLSDIASVSSVLGGTLPGGIQVPSPYHDQYDASVTARQPLFDATRTRRAAVENAQTNEAVSRIAASLWQSRQQVNDAFFAIQLFDAQERTIDLAVADLNARRTSAQDRVQSGAALPSEVMMLDAEVAKRNQMKSELQAQRAAALDVLNALTGMNITPGTPLAVRGDTALPVVTEATATRSRREYDVFQRSRETINARSAELSARDLPKVSAFGRVGYGRPGLNPLGRSFDAYWNAGLQLEWSPLNWGRTNRELQIQRLQTAIVASEEAEFTETVRRTALSQLGQVTALEKSLSMDDSILSLRDRVLRETRLRFDEGEVTSADYIARQTELLAAQLDRDTRRVRLSEARVRYLTTLGREVR